MVRYDIAFIYTELVHKALNIRNACLASVSFVLSSSYFTVWLCACPATELEISTEKKFALFVKQHKSLCYLLTFDGVCVWLMAVQQHARGLEFREMYKFVQVAPKCLPFEQDTTKQRCLLRKATMGIFRLYERSHIKRY